MMTFEVNDMTCGRCANTISKAVAGIDKDANVQFDLRRHRVVVEPKNATMQQLSDAIQSAGYSPIAIDNDSSVPAATKRGCCCG